LKRALVLSLTLTLAGCVQGTPFEPEMCVVQADSSVVVVSEETLRICSRPTIQRTEVRR
jgi:hypothetical protein